MNSDILIIGAGVIGLASALELLKRGAKVTVLERGSCGNESSWAGGGILSPLCPWDYPDEVTRLTARGAALFPAWAEELHTATGIDPEYEASGMLVLPPFDMQTAHQWCAKHDVKMETLPSPASGITSDLAALPPSRMASSSIRGAGGEGNAILLPDVAQVRNPRLMRALRSRVEILGGRIIEQCAVREIKTENNRVSSLVASCGEFSADHYIVTAGAWSKEVLGKHALHLDIKPMRGQMLLFKFDAPPLRHIVLKGDLYLIPRRDGHLLVGSTLEDVGFDKSITQAAYTSLRQRAEEILPQLRGMPLIQHWAGLRPGSPHNIPAIARHPQLENLYINAGHFRYGVTMATASVEILLNEMTGVQQPFDVSPYSISRSIEQ